MKIKDLKDFLNRNMECPIDLAIIINRVEGKNSNGNRYFSLTLQDSTGTIEAKKWEIESGDEDLLAVKKVVAVKGYPMIYKDSQLQFKITEVEPVSTYDDNDLILSSPVDKDSLEKDLLCYIEAIEDKDIKAIVEEVVTKHYKELLTYPAAKSNHHEYAHGLLHHKVSMLNLAKEIATLYPDINRDLLYGGILLHDIGKTVELSGPIATDYTLKGKLIGHISLVQTDIVEAGKKYNVDDETITLLQHIALSHHGKLEYGSPILPQTLEAEVIHLIDNIDSKIVMIEKALKDVKIGGYSNRVLGLDNRSFYKHHKSKN